MRPGKELSKRPLHFYLLADCSGSMSLNGKIQALNSAVREALPHMKKVASENPFARLEVSTIRFSHGASWHNKGDLIDDFIWHDLIADEMEKGSSGQVDIVFLIDTSGSMSDEIDAVKQSCTDFANHIEKEGVSVRLGLVGFGIGGHRKSNLEVNYEVKDLSRYTIGIWNLNTPHNFKKNISTFSLGLLGGGGCYIADNDTVDIFPHVVNVFDRSSESSKILVIISDEIGGNSGSSQIINLLNDNNISTYVLGVSKGGNGAHEEIAKKTGAEFWDITKTKGVNSFNKLLDDVGEVIAKEVSKKLSSGVVSFGTDMGEAVKLVGSQLVMPPMPEKALPPVLVLISDGEPTDDYLNEIKKLNSLRWAKKAVRLAIAIGEDADLKNLQAFIGNNEIKPFKANNPEQLLKFIKWVSTEVVKTVSSPPTTLVGKNNGKNIPKPFFDEKEDSGDFVW